MSHLTRSHFQRTIPAPDSLDIHVNRNYDLYVLIEVDPVKDVANLRKH